jgi:hypothetical protein
MRKKVHPNRQSRQVAPMQRNGRRKKTAQGTTVFDDRLRQLATRFGVAPSYVDEGGVRRLVNDASLRRVLSVMGVHAQDSTQVTERMREVRSGRWREMVDPVMVVRMDQLPRTVSLRLPVAVDQLRRITLTWRLRKEQGGILTGRSVGSRIKVLGTTIQDGLRC